jgi:uncharacterized protein Yka (UPF0111/DUF47 family)
MEDAAQTVSLYDLKAVTPEAKRLAELCLACCEKVQAAVALLHKTFITPLDRDDIHKLITRMDDILDMMEDAAQTISLYDLHAVTPEAKRLAELCLACCEKVQQAVGMLHNMDNAQKMVAICEEIDRLESDADHVMRAAMSKLFRDEPDVRNLI